MNANQTQICSRCGYESNPITASYCLNCNHLLDRANVSDSKSFAIPWSVVPLIGLLLLSVGLYGFWRNNISKKTASNFSSPLVTPTRQPQPSSNELNSASRLQSYNVMRDVANVPKGLFNYGGALAFAALRSHGMMSAIAKSHPNFYLRYTQPLNSQPGSDIAIRMLLDGDLSFVESVRSLKDADYTKAKQRGFQLKQVPIALDGIVFFVHPELPIARLSIDQIQAIFIGKVTNWKQVGGPNLPVVPFTLDPKIASSTLNILLKGLKHQKLGDNVRIARDYTNSIRQVASTPGGISYGSAAIVFNQRSISPILLAKPYSRSYIEPFPQGRINAAAFRDGTYPLTRRLFIIIRQDGTFEEQAGVAYANLLLSDEGQQIIEKAGFVPIHR